MDNEVGNSEDGKVIMHTHTAGEKGLCDRSWNLKLYYTRGLKMYFLGIGTLS